MTDLVSIPDELLGNVQELLQFFRHDVCGGRKCKRVVVPYSHEPFTLSKASGTRQASVQGIVSVELAARFIR